MIQFFLGSFLLGLLLLVASMLWGVERAPKEASSSGADGPPVRARLTVPNLGAFAALFGATGYLLQRHAGMEPLGTLAVAALLGVLGVVGASLLIARWAVPGVAAEVVDERYLLQGHPARITRVLQGEDGGSLAYEISYEDGGRRHTASARSLDDALLPEGADVVIERVEGGYAWVEPWAVVEKRL
jgi:hypothetical protein